MGSIQMSRTGLFHSSHRLRSRGRVWALIAGIVAVLALAGGAADAFGGQSATGDQAFYPCDRCHPVTVDDAGNPSHPLPVDLKKHEITLEVHDVLGEDDTACLACHDDPSRNPGMLKLPDGSLVEVTGDVSRVCQTCHMEKYREWTDGIHGKDAPKCSAAGCHDPHTPSWIYMAPLPPFQGTGVEIKAVGAREPFQPLAGPPLDAAVFTPLWLVVMTGLGGLVVLSAIGYLVFGGRKR